MQHGISVDRFALPNVYSLLENEKDVTEKFKRRQKEVHMLCSNE